MGFLSQLANAFTGSESAKAARQAGQIQQQQAISSAGNINLAGQAAISRFDPLNAVGAQGFNQASFLTDPEQQAQFLQGNPLFDLALDNLNKQTRQSSSSRGRLSAGDTLQELTGNLLLAGQPLIDKQSKNIFDLLGIGERAIGNQANIGLGTAQNVSNLLTGGAAASAAGKVGAQTARTGAFGNVIDVAALLAGSPVGITNPQQSPIIPDSKLNLSQIPALF